MATIIRIFASGERAFEHLIEDYEPADYGGVIPAVGDTIVSVGVDAGLDRNDPENRRLYEVKQRYFLPREVGSDLARVALVVAVRPGEPSEINILG